MAFHPEHIFIVTGNVFVKYDLMDGHDLKGSNICDEILISSLEP